MSTAIQPAASATASTLGLGTGSATPNPLTAGTGSSGSDPAAALKAISDQVAALQQQTDQAKITTQDFQKNTNDLAVDTRLTARNVGVLQANTSRLNVFSSLEKNDPVDFFTFTVAQTADTKLGTLDPSGGDSTGVRYQLLNSSGTVIADSAATSGDQKDAFDQLQAGTFNLQAGKYVLRISRSDDSSVNKQNSFQYAVQLSQGLFKNDFDTIEKPTNPTADPYGLPANSALDSLTASLAGAVNDLQNLPPIGTSASDKLTGVLSSLVV